MRYAGIMELSRGHVAGGDRLHAPPSKYQTLKRKRRLLSLEQQAVVGTREGQSRAYHRGTDGQSIGQYTLM